MNATVRALQDAAALSEAAAEGRLRALQEELAQRMHEAQEEVEHVAQEGQHYAGALQKALEHAFALSVLRR